MEIGPTHRTEPVAVSILSVQVVAEGMLFGAHRLPRWRLEMLARQPAAFANVRKRLEAHPNVTRPELPRAKATCSVIHPGGPCRPPGGGGRRSSGATAGRAAPRPCAANPAAATNASIVGNRYRLMEGCLQKQSGI